MSQFDSSQEFSLEEAFGGTPPQQPRQSRQRRPRQPQQRQPQSEFTLNEALGRPADQRQAEEFTLAEAAGQESDLSAEDQLMVSRFRQEDEQLRQAGVTDEQIRNIQVARSLQQAGIDPRSVDVSAGEVEGPSVTELTGGRTDQQTALTRLLGEEGAREFQRVSQETPDVQGQAEALRRQQEVTQFGFAPRQREGTPLSVIQSGASSAVGAIPGLTAAEQRVQQAAVTPEQEDMLARASQALRESRRTSDPQERDRLARQAASLLDEFPELTPADLAAAGRLEDLETGRERVIAAARDPENRQALSTAFNALEKIPFAANQAQRNTLAIAADRALQEVEGVSPADLFPAVDPQEQFGQFLRAGVAQTFEQAQAPVRAVAGETAADVATTVAGGVGQGVAGAASLGFELASRAVPDFAGGEALGEAATGTFDIAQGFGGGAAQAGADTLGQRLSSVLTGVSRSLTQLSLFGKAGGRFPLVGRIAGFAGSSANNTFQRAKRKGLDEAAATKAALRAGIIEGGVTALASRLGASGLEAVGLGRLRNSVRGAFRQAGVRAVEELPEEILIEVFQSANEVASGIDPNARDPEGLARRIQDTMLSTLLTVGAASTPGIARTTIDAFQERTEGGQLPSDTEERVAQTVDEQFTEQDDQQQTQELGEQLNLFVEESIQDPPPPVATNPQGQQAEVEVDPTVDPDFNVQNMPPEQIRTLDPGQIQAAARQLRVVMPPGLTQQQQASVIEAAATGQQVADPESGQPITTRTVEGEQGPAIVPSLPESPAPEAPQLTPESPVTGLRQQRGVTPAQVQSQAIQQVQRGATPPATPGQQTPTQAAQQAEPLTRPASRPVAPPPPQQVDLQMLPDAPVQPQEVSQEAGQAVAQQTGLTFNGIQERPSQTGLLLFTDPETGTTFSVGPNESARQRLQQARQSFQEAQQTVRPEEARRHSPGESSPVSNEARTEAINVGFQTLQESMPGIQLVTMDNAPSTARESALDAERLTGRPVVFYRGGRGRGVFVSSARALFINLDRNQSIAQLREVIVHEAFHALQQEQGGRAEQVWNAIPESMRQQIQEQYLNSFFAQEGAEAARRLAEDPARLQEEVISYAAGKAITGNIAYRAAFDQQRGRWQQLLNRVTEMLRSLTGRGRVTNAVIRAVRDTVDTRVPEGVQLDLTPEGGVNAVRLRSRQQGQDTPPDQFPNWLRGSKPRIPELSAGAWLGPEGEMIPVPQVGDHNQQARTILERFNVPHDKNNVRVALWNEGFARMSNTGQTTVVEVPPGKISERLTKRIREARDLARRRDLPFELRDPVTQETIRVPARGNRQTANNRLNAFLRDRAQEEDFPVRMNLTDADLQFLPESPEVIARDLPEPNALKKIGSWINKRMRSAPRKRPDQPFAINWSAQVKSLLSNTYAPFMQASDLAIARAGKQGLEITPDTDPEILLRMVLGHASEVEGQFRHGLRDAEGRLLTDSKTGAPMSHDWLIQPVIDFMTPDARADEAGETLRLWLERGVAERVIERSRQRDQMRQQLRDLREQAKQPDLDSRTRNQLSSRIKSLRKELQGQIKQDRAISPFFKRAQRQGITEAEAAQQFLDSFKGTDQDAPSQEFLRRYRLFADQLLTLGVETGYWSEEEVFRMRRRNEYFINMSRLMDEFAPGHREQIAPNKQLHRFRGSDRLIDNPLPNMLATYDRLSEAMQMNRAMGAYVNMAAATGSTDIARQVEKAGPNTITVRLDGELTHWELPEDVLTAFRESRMLTRVPGMSWALGGIGRLQRMGVVAAPAFLLRNTIRGINVSIIRSVAPLENFVRGVDFSKLLQDKAELESLGGSFQLQGFSQGVDNYKKLLRRRLQQLTKDDRTIVSFPRKLWQGWTKLGEMSEMLPRVENFQAVKRRALSKGFNQRQAKMLGAIAARDVTDFALSGSLIQEINNFMYTPFLNASFQGLSSELSFIRLALGGRGTKVEEFLGEIGQRRMQAWSRLVMFSILPGLAPLAFAAAQGDEVLEEYRNLPGWRRDLFSNFIIGDFTLSIPKPFTLGIFGTIADRTADFGMGNDKAFDDIMGSATRIVSPIDRGFLTNNAFGPVIEAIANKQFFFNRHIIPPWEDTEALRLRNTRFASSFGKWVSEAMSAAGMETDPRMVDHFVQGYTGGSGNMLLGVSDIGREDKAGTSIAQTAARFSGVISVPPGRSARNVNKVLEESVRIGDDQFSAIRELRDQVSRIWRADTVAERNDRAKQAREMAAELETFYDRFSEKLLDFNVFRRKISDAEREWELLQTPAERRQWEADNPLMARLRRAKGRANALRSRVNTLRENLDRPNLAEDRKERIRQQLDDALDRANEFFKEVKNFNDQQ